MATQRWLGGANTQAQLTLAVPAAVAIGNMFTLTVNGKNVVYTAAAATVADVTAGLVAAVIASTAPEWLEITATDKTTYVLLTATTAGKPFTVTSATGVGTGSGAPTLTVSQTLTTPVNSTFSDVATGGSLAFNTTYYYRVSATNAAGETLASTETSKITANDAANTHKITVTWLRVPGATGYKIYGRSTGAELYIAGVQGEATLTYTDDGSITPAGTLPGSNTTATASQGPNDWSTAANWSAGTVPVAADDVYIENVAVSILYGLGQQALAALNSLNIAASFTGTIGLPQYNGTYYEYRTDYLRISATSVFIGYGLGAGSGRIKLDTGANQTTVIVTSTSAPLDTTLGYALLFKGTHASNTFEINKGSAAIAVFAGEIATVLTLLVGFTTNILGDVRLKCGSGATLTTVKQSGGKLETNSAVTTATQIGGWHTHVSGVITTATVDGGTLYYVSTTTLPTLNVGAKGTVDASQDMRARTFTAVNVYAGATVYDPFGTITIPANGLTAVRCTLADCSLTFGPNRTYQVT